MYMYCAEVPGLYWLVQFSTALTVPQDDDLPTMLHSPWPAAAHTSVRGAVVTAQHNFNATPMRA